jgi:hypothetical protein
MKCYGIRPLQKFDASRLEQSKNFLSEFAEARTLHFTNGTTLEWFLYTPQNFQKWIEDHGGVRAGDWIYPRTEGDWKQLQRLREFRCFEEIGKAFRVPEQIAHASDKCILRCIGFGLDAAMDKAMIGTHLSKGFNYAIFNWRKEDISIKKSFEDAEAVCRALCQEGFPMHALTAIGSCRATFVVGRLIEKFHDEGLNAVMVQAPPSLKSAIEHQTWPANRLGSLALESIEKDAHFDTLGRLRSLTPGTASLCLIMCEGDNILPPQAIHDLGQAAKKAGPCEIIIKPKKPGAPDPHFIDPLRDPNILESYFNFLKK